MACLTVMSRSCCPNAVKVSGTWTYLYRAVDQHGQVIDVLLSVRRDLAAARRFCGRALRAGTIPVEVTTDRARVYPRVLDDLIPSALADRRAVREQPDRGRPRAAESPAPADARPEASPLRSDPRRRTCLCAEPPTRALRRRHRHPEPTPVPHRLRRPGDHHLNRYSIPIMLKRAQRWHNATAPPRVTAWGSSPWGETHICVYGRHQRGIGSQDCIMMPSGLIGLSPWLAWRVDGHRDLPAGGYQELPDGGHLGR